MQQVIDQLVRHYRESGPVVLLESQPAGHPAAQKTFVAALPSATIKAWGDRIQIVDGGKQTIFNANPWRALQAFYAQQDDWLFGYLGYDLKNSIEVLSSNNPDSLGAPDLFFMNPGVLFEVDLKSQKLCEIKGSLPVDVSSVMEPSDVVLENVHSTISKKAYLSNIATAQNDIYEGSYYEINLSHQLQAQFSGSPFQLYRKMRETGRVPFGAFISFGEYAVCSMSPERFLSKKGAMVFSQPIKGTRRRDPEESRDNILKNELLASPKEKAENLMIVDLVRNDLSRIAMPGSVQVTDLFGIQTFGTVHQMVSTIKAEAIVSDPVEIIKACYPMGSMTGAPKISAMQAIEDIENYRRGIYSGAIGYFSPDCNFDFNVVIRTAIIKKELLCYAIGGAVTSDSDPDGEWEETWLKAKALTDAIENPAKILKAET